MQLGYLGTDCIIHIILLVACASKVALQTLIVALGRKNNKKACSMEGDRGGEGVFSTRISYKPKTTVLILLAVSGTLPNFGLTEDDWHSED